MKLIQIQYFLTIAACKSITRAAEQLYVSQPAVTKQMNLLEQELGVRLMNRVPSGIELTEAGAVFAEDMRNVMEEMDKAVAKAVSAGTKKPDVIRIGCFDGAFTDDFLPELYAGLKAAMPQLRIRLGRHSAGENKKALETDQIDLLIALRSPDEEDAMSKSVYRRKILAKREGAFIFSKDSPLAKKKKLTPKDFQKETFFVVGDIGASVKPGLQTLKRLGIESPNIEEADNFASMMSSVRLGLGFTALAKEAVDSEPDLMAYPLPEGSGMEVVAIWKKENSIVDKLMK